MFHTHPKQLTKLLCVRHFDKRAHYISYQTDPDSLKWPKREADNNLYLQT